MSDPKEIAILKDAKAKASFLKKKIDEDLGLKVSHSVCLHEISRLAGFKNWNTYRAHLLREGLKNK